jgi:hypothetical protein
VNGHRGEASEEGAVRILAALLKKGGAPDNPSSQEVLRMIVGILYRNGGFLGVKTGTPLASMFPIFPRQNVVSGPTQVGCASSPERRDALPLARKSNADPLVGMDDNFSF